MIYNKLKLILLINIQIIIKYHLIITVVVVIKIYKNTQPSWNILVVERKSRERFN